MGVNQNQTTSNLLGWVDMFSGSTFKGTGNASYERGEISPVINYTSSYAAGSVTFATGTSTSDVLAIKSSVQQYDPNYLVNEYGDWDPATRQADPTKLITAHVTGAGVVALQDGGVSSYTTSRTASGRSIAASFRSARSWRILLLLQTRPARAGAVLMASR